MIQFNTLSFNKKTCFLFIIIPFSFLMNYKLSIHTLNNNSISSSNHNQSLSYINVPMPCIEPHCTIECLVTYESHEKDGIIRNESLSKLEQQHLMIDMGFDTIVEELIKFIPSYKVCPYRQRLYLFFQQNTNTTVKFYPIVFGFVDQYLPKPILRQILINNKIETIEQICLPKKTKDFSELIPGQTETYKFHFENELDYRRLYSTAYFAITMKKSGWDANRHYEIISSGAMPFFDQLNQINNYTLSLLPKSLLNQAQLIKGVNRQYMSIDHQVFDINQYYLLLHRLLYYSKHRLTTTKIVEYILNVIKYPFKSSQNHSILFISHEKSDYLKDFMLHGFTQIFKQNLHVFQPPYYMYQYPMSNIWNIKETKQIYGEILYGFGYGYKLTLKNYFHLYQRDKKEFLNQNILETNIKMKNYSLVVFGSIIRENKLFSLVKQYYNQSKIIIIDGEDTMKDTRRSYFAKYGTYFIREIQDDCDRFM